MRIQPDRYKCLGVRRYAAFSLLVFLISITYLVNPRGVYGPGAGVECSVSASPVGSPPKAEGGITPGGRARINVDAPLPYLRRGDPAERFEALRLQVVIGAGFDFLAKCGDMMRDGAARPSKPGVVYRSRHKTGEAFDYNQEDPRVLLVREYRAGRTYWRTYLKCERQDGTMGVRADLLTDNAGSVSAYVFDFTAAAEGLGWQRIPAKGGWGRAPTKKEYWHYEMTEDGTSRRDVTLINAGLSVEKK